MARHGPLERPALLCVVPPYSLAPPAGAAYLLAYAQQQGCSDFGFLDLRLGVPDAYAPTYAHTGVFGDAYVMDIPDLPLVLALVAALPRSPEPGSIFSEVIEKYALQRGISASYLNAYLNSIDKYLAGIAAQLHGVRFVGCSVWTSNYLTTLQFAAHLKRLPQPPIIVAGGPQLTESYASAAIALRSHLLDYVVQGEGEVSLLDLYSRVLTNGDAANTPGTLSLDECGQIVRGPTQDLLSPNEIPLPAYDQMHLLSYQEPGTPLTLPYHFSRGCTDKCTFCSEWVFWRRFRPSNAPTAVSGVLELQRRYGAEYISFTDSLINGHRARLREFAESMVRRKRRVPWAGFMRAEMDTETASLLRKSGCDVVFVGIESMSDDTLELMNKRRTEADNIKALRSFLQAGIHVVAGVIPGFPGDSREAFIHTVKQLRNLQHDYPGHLRMNVEPFIVSPGQPLFARLDEMGLRGLPWDDEILDVAPEYRDITASVLCTVQGLNQGVERIGRLLIAEAIESDEPTKTDPFLYKVAEPITHSDFDFEPLTPGWFLARTKGPAASIYALIVTQAERDELVSKCYDLAAVDLLGAPKLQRLLKRLENSHSLKPSAVPPVAYGGFKRQVEADVLYQTSPYLVSRRGDWHVNSRIIVADFVTTASQLLPCWQGEMLKNLRQAPRSAPWIQRRLQKRGVTRSLDRCVRLLQDLAQIGALLVIPCAPSTTTGRVNRAVHAVTAPGLMARKLTVLPTIAAAGSCHTHHERTNVQTPQLAAKSAFGK